MRKLLLLVGFGLLGGFSCGTGTDTAVEETGITQRPVATELPTIQDYIAGDPLPTGPLTHLVVAYCKDLGDFMAVGVNASSGTVAFRLRANDPTTTSRFLSAAYGAGVPVTVFTADVLVPDEEVEPPTPGLPDLPITGVIFPVCTSEVGDPLPPRPPPTGHEALRWMLLTDLAIDTSRVLHRVARPVPPTTP
ncbi:hypothetical protein BO221_03380 [Archangium sp. Cb G35]|uniref:hypothetical protein n=1 Tax=Archangium sp. Cb G35 TaxID=1920190 RepID=UPI000936822C|nr:hypothetical protein [Archangium sp. Cb G35]OJT27051.1 hypothetical protein BO221_03380 [Archangium sp. Cb G35]